MKVRAVTPSDIPEWSRMRTRLWPDTDDNHLKEIKAFFSNDSIDIIETLVLEKDNEYLAGFVELNIRNFAEGSSNKEVPYIEGWYVDDDVRGMGFGKSLVTAAEKWSISKGYNEIGSDTEVDNSASIAAHKALGFKEIDRVVCFLKQLK